MSQLARPGPSMVIVALMNIQTVLTIRLSTSSPAGNVANAECVTCLRVITMARCGFTFADGPFRDQKMDRASTAQGDGLAVN
jgi:hypothetical protein